MTTNMLPSAFSLHRLMCGAALVAAVGASAAAVGCGTTTTFAGADDDNNAAETCVLTPPAEVPFTFKVKNVGTRSLRLTYGCGRNLPIDLSTADGMRGIGAGSIDFCEASCDSVYDGYPNWGCSDCGPGYGDALPPGATVEIEWDRRVFVEHTAPSECSGSEDGNECALGVAPDPATTVQGTLTVCTNESDGIEGYCSSDEEEQVPFDIDLKADDLLIEVQ